ncbi:MAG TPA: DUF262 domain-containing protein [Mycobacteriales bacterium]|nr:DUF262 domain-containing protein [Mycobacteriales bacterium]
MSSRPDARPSAITYDLEELVALAWKGDIRVPHFQRDFRWGRQDVSRLFDSIVRGYPIGSLLLWVRPAPADILRLGVLDIRAPDAERALWVVDGQQRIISLANALHPSGATDPRFAVAYDLRAENIVRRTNQETPWVIPLPVVFDLQQLIRWFSERPEIAEYLNRATAVARDIRQFKIPAYHVKHDEAVLRDIFDRMNSYGKRLSRAEIFSALKPGVAGTREQLTIDLVAQRINTDLHFGELDDGTVLQAILARRGPDVMRGIRKEFVDQRRGQVDFPGESRDDAYKNGAEALRSAVFFVQSLAGVPHFSFLPYRYLLVVLARFFAHHPDPARRNLQLLRRWFWRAALAGPGIFRGGTTGGLRLLCAEIRPGDVNRSVQGLLRAIGPAARAVPTPDMFRPNSAETKIVLCCLWSLRPLSPRTGARYERSQLAEILAGRGTAGDATAQIVRGQSVSQRDQARIANRVLSPDPDESVDGWDQLLLAEPLQFGADWSEVLRSHAMDESMVALLAAGREAEFLDARQRELAGALNGFLARACEWGFEDTSPLDDLVVDDDNPEGESDDDR